MIFATSQWVAYLLVQIEVRITGTDKALRVTKDGDSRGLLMRLGKKVSTTPTGTLARAISHGIGNSTCGARQESAR